MTGQDLRRIMVDEFQAMVDDGTLVERELSVDVERDGDNAVITIAGLDEPLYTQVRGGPDEITDRIKRAVRLGVDPG